MHEVINFLKPAVMRGATGAASCYCIRGDQIYAWNKILMAGAPSPLSSLIPIDVDLCIPAAALDRILDTKGMQEGTPRIELGGDTSIVEHIADTEVGSSRRKAYGNASLVVRSSRSRGTILCLADEPEPIPDLGSLDWHETPPGLIDAMRMAQPFVMSLEDTRGQHVWRAGIRLMDERVTALFNVAAIDIKVPGLVCPAPSLVSEKTVSFLASTKDRPIANAIGKGNLYFRWADGRWMRTQLLEGEMPEETIERLFNNIGDESPIAIDEGCRISFEDTLSDGSVMLDSRGWHGRDGALQMDALWSSGLPEDHVSVWPADHLGHVLKHATRWNPAAYLEGKPARFDGENFRGMVMGQRR